MNVAKFKNSMPGLLAVGALLLTPATGAFAATDGGLGASSTGTVNINASVPSRVRISGLADVDFTNTDPAATNVFSAQDVCVWSNTATSGYSLTATGDGASNAFTLAAGAATVPYSVEWADTTGATTGTSLTAGSQQTGFVSGATHQLCNVGTDSASLIIRLADADLSTMQSGQVYTGVLTLLVQPE